MNFHDQKLWQQSYVALMDIHKALEGTNTDSQDQPVVKDLVESAQELAAMIADSLTRQDRRVARDLSFVAVGQVAKTRTHLAVAWGRGIVNDEIFRRLDEKYDTLSSALQKS